MAELRLDTCPQCGRAPLRYLRGFAGYRCDACDTHYNNASDVVYAHAYAEFVRAEAQHARAEAAEARADKAEAKLGQVAKWLLDKGRATGLVGDLATPELMLVPALYQAALTIERAVAFERARADKAEAALGELAKYCDCQAYAAGLHGGVFEAAMAKDEDAAAIYVGAIRAYQDCASHARAFLAGQEAPK